MADTLMARATIQIAKPAAEVFEAIVSPDGMRTGAFDFMKENQ